MLSTYQYPKFEYIRPPELSAKTKPRYPVVIVGAGPVGLAAAIDLAQSGISVVLLDDDDTVSVGSRGVCYAKRTIEILDRLGIGDQSVEKGVSWNVGRTFFNEQEVYNFNLRPQEDHKRPGMINLQQYYLEEYEIRRAAELPNLALRFKNKVVSVESKSNGTHLKVETPDGTYELETDWLIVADGARSSIRTMLNLDIDGKIFMDRFLIADVVMKAEFPHERWFWFDPPFHPGQSVLLHRQADNVYRIDFQLGWGADPDEERKPENVIPRIKAMLGDDREFELEWVSVYTFQCRRMNSFIHDRILFVGDAAHQVSPFGARGANSGIQDTDNLCWKLKLVIDGKAPLSLLDSYSEERIFAADENILNSTRATDFITPKSKVSMAIRNATLSLAKDYEFARALVNSGRLSVPAVLTNSKLNTPDTHRFIGDMVPGAAMDDAPVYENNEDIWLLDQIGNSFSVLVYVSCVDQYADFVERHSGTLADFSIPNEILLVTATPGAAPKDTRLFVDYAGKFAERYDAQPGSTWLIRPDQHIAARWRNFEVNAIKAALARATSNNQKEKQYAVDTQA